MFWIFLNFCYNDRALNMRWDAIMEEFWVIKDSKYARLMHMQAMQKVLNMPEYGWIIPYGRLLNLPSERFTGFQIRLWFKRIWPNKPDYTLIMSRYGWICLNNGEYDWTFWHISEKTESWVCQNYAWCSIQHKVTVRITE